MALKTTNYTVAETGAVLPNAVALVTHLDTVNNKATLSIAANRENALNGIVAKKVTVDCDFDRSGDLMTQAYKSATQPKTDKIVNEETGEEKEVRVLPYFHNWQDDIV